MVHPHFHIYLSPRSHSSRIYRGLPYSSYHPRKDNLEREMRGIQDGEGTYKKKFVSWDDCRDFLLKVKESWMNLFFQNISVSSVFVKVTSSSFRFVICLKNCILCVRILAYRIGLLVLSYRIRFSIFITSYAKRTQRI